MTKAFRKNIKRSITGSLGRYIAILMIIALGVGFFAGLKSTRPAMISAAVHYMQDQNMFDLRILSTIGFTEDEIEEISKLPNLRKAEGSFFQDILILNDAGNELVLRAHTMPEKINQISLVAGRMPESPDECILDAHMFKEDMIGKTIRLSDTNDSDMLAKFNYREYTVTGIATSPIYLNIQRGNTSLGNGTISAFTYIPRGGFDFEYYTEAYALCDTDLIAFTEDYDEAMEELAEKLEGEILRIVQVRFDDALSDAQGELNDAKAELAIQTKDADEKLADAKEELDDAERKLTDAKAELDDAKQKLDESAELLAGEGATWEAALAKGKQSLKDAEKEYEEQIKDAEKKLKEAYETLASAETEYNKNLSEYTKQKEALDAGKMQYQDGSKQYEEGKQQYEAAAPLLPEEQKAAMEAQLAEAKAELDANKQLLEQSERQLAAANIQLNDAKAQIDAGWNEYHNSVAEFESEKKKGREQLDEASSDLQSFEDGMIQYKDGYTEYEDGVAEYQDGIKEYEDAIKERDTKLADANREISEAEEKINDLSNPEAYLFSREMNIGYVSFQNDSGIVDGIAKVFPVFFFLIAALVCSTTMTRMIDDDRTQIGTFRALGISSKSILLKYLLYSGSAAVVGCIGGYILGAMMFPKAIWTAYKMLYQFAEIEPVYNISLLIISLIGALLCSVGTTFAACKNEMRRVPAELIRPKTPEAGKRILLEKITPIWKHMKFLHKVSMRNIFRFKKRMFMMILGISGCTALVLTGFGIEDSIANIANFQFDDIQKYNISVNFTDEISEETRKLMDDEYSEEIDRYASLNLSSIDVLFDHEITSVSMVASDDDKLPEIIDFHLKDEKVSYPEEGEVLITEKLAQKIDKKVGDVIELKQGESNIVSLKISGIVENYVYNYVYLTGQTYTEYFKESYQPKTLYIRTNAKTDEYQLAAKFQSMDSVSNVQIVRDLRDTVEQMMKSMDAIILLVIACAGALAFIVLFNLGNINISERVREIATIKVLGFHARETGAYVFRENLVLSMIGIIVGLPLGILLHRFVMSQIKIDMVTFKIAVAPLSYLYAVLTVLAFTIITDLIMRRKIEKIDMAESLKSIE